VRKKFSGQSVRAFNLVYWRFQAKPGIIMARIGARFFGEMRKSEENQVSLPAYR